MPPSRRRALVALALGSLGAAGCATMSGLGVGTGLRTVSPNPLIVPSDDLEQIWKQCVAVTDEYFDGLHENRLARTIITDPKIGATLVEPWYGDSVGFYERLESSLQTIRRWARITVKPAPGGGYAVNVEVFKEIEDMSKPERQAGGRAQFDTFLPVDRTREIVGPVPLPNGWILRGRDHKLEQVILARLRRNLFL
jgi:hypothetical protein